MKALSDLRVLAMRDEQMVVGTNTGSDDVSSVR